MPAYVDKNLIKIKPEKWKKLQSDKNYTVARLYENDRFKVCARWHGFVRDANKAPREYWRPFELVVHNITIDPLGERHYAEDPTVSENFGTEKDAIQAYHDFLERYTDCHWEEDDNPYSDTEGAVWIESDNIHSQELESEAQPEPDRVHIPDSDDSTGSLAGSW